MQFLAWSWGCCPAVPFRLVTACAILLPQVEGTRKAMGGVADPVVFFPSFFSLMKAFLSSFTVGPSGSTLTHPNDGCEREWEKGLSCSLV